MQNATSWTSVTVLASTYSAIYGKCTTGIQTGSSKGVLKALLEGLRTWAEFEPRREGRHRHGDMFTKLEQEWELKVLARDQASDNGSLSLVCWLPDHIQYGSCTRGLKILKHHPDTKATESNKDRESKARTHGYNPSRPSGTECLTSGWQKQGRGKFWK